jgi:hypothetical protein
VKGRQLKYVRTDEDYSSIIRIYEYYAVRSDLHVERRRALAMAKDKETIEFFDNAITIEKNIRYFSKFTKVGRKAGKNMAFLLDLFLRKYAHGEVKRTWKQINKQGYYERASKRNSLKENGKGREDGRSVHERGDSQEKHEDSKH